MQVIITKLSHPFAFAPQTELDAPSVGDIVVMAECKVQPSQAGDGRSQAGGKFRGRR